MRVDEYGTLVMEHVDFPGNIGDSCAETSKLIRLITYTKIDRLLLQLSTQHFFTQEGWLRHPTSPWREDDMPTDQLLPLWLVTRSANIYSSITKNNWRLPNGDLIQPIFFAFIKNWQWLIELCVFLQAMFFKIPFRWNDEKKWFESSKDSSCDYSLWFVCAIYTKWAYRFVDPRHLKERLQHYYRNEPNSGWVLDYYFKAIDKKWNIRK